MTIYKLSEYLMLIQEYERAVARVKNMAEERESKVGLLVKVAMRRDLCELEEKGVPLMRAIRRVSEKMAKEMRKGLLVKVNEKGRGWQGLYQLIESKAYP